MRDIKDSTTFKFSDRIREVGAVLFDWDGTLYDSLPHILQIMGELCTHFGGRKPTATDCVEGLRPPYPDFYRSLGVRATDEEIWAKWSGLYPDTQVFELFPDVPPTLKVFQTLGLKMGIVSHQKVERLSDLVVRFGLSHHFSFVSAQHDGGKVGCMHRACTTFDMAPGHVLYVGDFASDMQDATRAGLIPVGITRGLGTKEILRGAGALHVIDRLTDINQMLR